MGEPSWTIEPYIEAMNALNHFYPPPQYTWDVVFASHPDPRYQNMVQITLTDNYRGWSYAFTKTTDEMRKLMIAGRKAGEDTVWRRIGKLLVILMEARANQGEMKDGDL